MDNILLSDSNIDTLERTFEEVKKALPKCELQILLKKNAERRFYQFPKL